MGSTGRWVLQVDGFNKQTSKAGRWEKQLEEEEEEKKERKKLKSNRQTGKRVASKTVILV